MLALMLVGRWQSVWSVDDGEATTLSVDPVSGYEPDWLIDGLVNSVAATRSQ